MTNPHNPLFRRPRPWRGWAARDPCDKSGLSTAFGALRLFTSRCAAERYGEPVRGVFVVATTKRRRR